MVVVVAAVAVTVKGMVPVGEILIVWSAGARRVYRKRRRVVMVVSGDLDSKRKAYQGNSVDIVIMVILVVLMI